MISDIMNLPEFGLCDEPTEDSKIVEWRYPTMYRLDAKGKRREWYGCIIKGGVVTSHGTVDGIKIISEPYVVELNGSGRNFIEQAALELRSRYEVKNRKEGFRFPGEMTSYNRKPMLAQDWHKRPPSTKLFYPVAVQPKLDGIRCLVMEDPDTCEIRYRSRTNKLYDFGYLFDEEINAMLPFFPSQVELDGEMYIHGTKLQNIASIVAMKSTAADLPNLKGAKKKHVEETLKLREEHLKYNIFTIITAKDLPYEDRNDILLKAFEAGEKSLGRPFEKLVLVPDHIADSMEEIEELSDEYVNELGYEGVMIYKLGLSLPKNKIKESYYVSSRSFNLIKFKPFFDEEMEIIAVKGGKGKSAELAGCTVVDSDGITHEVNIAEDDAVRHRIYLNPKLVIGKDATVKHYGRTEDGKLRHGNIICIRDYE